MKLFGATVAAAISLTACQTYSVEPAQDAVPVSASAEAIPVYVTAICGDCHALTGNAVSPNPEAPGFADIANSPGLTHDTVVAFLSDAHNYPMQMDVDLDEADIEDIADYMMTLQSDDYVTPPS